MKITSSGRGAFSSSKSKNGPSNLVTRNNERVAQAGRVGTKRFVDPCKVFVGNLPYEVSQDDLQEWLRLQLGTLANVWKVKLVRDWKTGQSKGYAFVDFCEAMAATSAMETLHGKEYHGRALNFRQGRRKRPDPVLFVKSAGEQAKDEEEAAIQAGLRQATENHEEERNELLVAEEGGEENDDDDEVVEFQFNPMEFSDYYGDDEDDKESTMTTTTGPLSEVEPALLETNDTYTALLSSPSVWDTLEPLELQDEELRNFDFDDVADDDDDDNDDDDNVDGVFEEVYARGGRLSLWKRMDLLENDDNNDDDEPPSNRQGRRDAARRLKKKKLPHKGFQPVA